MTDREPPELAGVHVASGISLYTGKGYCLIAAELTDGTRITGQLDPDDVRELAHGWLAAAEAAESDAAVYAELIETIGLDTNMAGGFIYALRERRNPPEGKPS